MPTMMYEIMSVTYTLIMPINHNFHHDIQYIYDHAKKNTCCEVLFNTEQTNVCYY